MRRVAMLLNLSLLVFIFFASVAYGFPYDDAGGMLGIIMAVIFCLINLYALSSFSSKGYFGLYLERKMLEEKKKIEDLKK